MFKKNLFIFITTALFSFTLTAQINNTIDITDEIYPVLDYLQTKGLIKPMISQKPYTQQYIIEKIDEALIKDDYLTQEEIIYLENWKNGKSDTSDYKLKNLSVRKETEEGKFHATFNSTLGFETSASGGLYTKDRFDQFGFDIISKISFFGDLSEKLSYRMTGYIDLTQMPLYSQGEYFVGYNWYELQNEEYIVDSYLRGYTKENGDRYDEPKRRTVTSLINTSYLPFRYQRLWDGQMYYLSNLTASGLEGWPQQIGVSGGIQGEIHLSAFDGHIEIGAGRYRRAYASMDEGASLVLNESARPFLGVDLAFNIFDWLQYSFVAGSLEYPNQDYMNRNSYNSSAPVLDDAYFFQNGYTLNMVEVNFPFMHIDFGSSVVWPKRFEMGYLFPLANYVEYQNHIGDGDNITLFGDLKFQKPGLGSVWASLFLDELSLGSDLFNDSRVMYAVQFGAKLLVPKIPFGTFSLRYTKVEPYCYTHQAIDYTPWYSHYIWENYTNNGESIGYYLPPNADEVLFKFEAQPKHFLKTSVQYQFVRHGADYGSQQVPGSSLYSELSPWNRENLHKYFLHDGAYNWLHILSASASVTMKKSRLPFQVFATAGLIYSYYTVIDSDTYEKHYDTYSDSYQNSADSKTVYTAVDTDEYPVRFGGILTFGIRLFNW